VIPITRYLKWEVPHRRIRRHKHNYTLLRKGKTMNENNRVLSRQNARELTPKEIDHVSGSINTLTICSAAPTKGGGTTNDCDTVG
jgi:hypothetical protein